MRMQAWSPEVVRFMEDAGRFGTYFHVLADVATRGLAPGATVVDAGCGMGQLSRAMLDRGMRVDAVDLSPKAVEYALAHPETCAPVRMANFFESGFIPRGCDRIVFSLSASWEDAFRIARENGAQSVVAFNKIHRYPHAGPGGDECRPIIRSMERVTRELEQLDYDCNAWDIVLDYGQPFRTLEDAQLYFRLFRTYRYPQGVTAGELRRILKQTGDAEFPYYLPVLRHLAVFEMQLEPAFGSADAQLGREAFAVLTRHSQRVRDMEQRAVI